MKTILLAEDDAVCRYVVGRTLRKHGYNVLEAEDGMVAERVLETHTPDLVVLDLMMPNLDGLEVLKHLRQRQFQTPILLFSALDHTPMVEEAQSLGVDGYIVKTATVLDDLLEQVEKLVGH